MGFRDWVNKNQTVASIIAGVGLVIALGMMVFQSGAARSSTSGGAYYFDPETEKIFTASGERIPPIESPDGNLSPRVHFYSCGACNESERFVGYYERYSEEDAKRLKEVNEKIKNATDETRRQAEREQQQAYGQAVLLASTDREEWVPVNSGAGRQLVRQIEQKCDDPEALKRCDP